MIFMTPFSDYPSVYSNVRIKEYFMGANIICEKYMYTYVPYIAKWEKRSTDKKITSYI